MATSKLDLEKVLLDPTSHFATPWDVVDEPTLADDDKLRILRQWEMDARELSVAEEENMGGGEEQPLDRVLRAIAALTGEVPHASRGAHKQGGVRRPPKD